ncbi:universal stress protein [Burkholderia plantarii]|uniref:universal stress protein n=1 Tax=Burkholderia plantarii TaxID=41899 RepID=UPI0008709AFD|nr:universal stress protein [Burkholderia plantarii]
MYQRIFVAVDGSETSRHAFDAALALSQSEHATLRAFYAVENAAIYYNVPGYDPSVLREQLVAQGSDLTRDFAQRMQDAGVTGDVLTGEAATLADVSSLILEAATEYGADLLVLGTHGRRGFKRLMLGSIAEQCVRQACLPVLLIPSAASHSNEEVEKTKES